MKYQLSTRLNTSEVIESKLTFQGKQGESVSTSRHTLHQRGISQNINQESDKIESLGQSFFTVNIH